MRTRLESTATSRSGSPRADRSACRARTRDEPRLSVSLSEVHRFFWVSVVVFFVVARASLAWAAPTGRVALGGSGPDPQLTRQLRVELAALGFEVVTIEDLGKGGLSAEALKLTRDEDLLAGIRASSHGPRPE